MADLAGADAYFAGTLRAEAWMANDEERRRLAVNEAGGQIGLLPLLRQPPRSSTDNAVYEQAFCLLEQANAGESDAAQAIAQGIRSRAVAGASESYTSAAEREKDPGWINGVFYCPRALSWLSGFMGTRVRGGAYLMRNGW